MTTALKLRRGTTSQHSTFTGADGEVTVDTTKKTVVVHDGATAGGKPLLTEANPSYTGTLTGGTGVVNLGSGQFYKGSGGDIGIGTSSPSARLHLGEAFNKTIRLDSATGNAAFFGGFNTYTIMASNRNPNTGVFVDTGKATGSILIDANNGVSNITFNTTTSNNTDPTERMRITSAGVVELAQGQIKFPASQVASADANTLDDYEEGTWTPSVTPGSGSLTSYSSGAYYTKIGRVVTVTGEVAILNGGTASGALLITNLPFTVISSRQQPSLVREQNATGLTYQGFTTGSTTFSINALDNTAVPFLAGRTYTFCITYTT